ncbi:MAG: hypothetical protein ACRCZG_01955 [Culicoidibacterales bacterium]
MELHIFKLNLQPNILKAYENDYEKLLTTNIPNALKILYSTADGPKGTLACSSQKISYNEIMNSQNYTTMILLKNKLIDMHRSVVDKFEKTGSINYSNEYLALRDKLERYTSAVLFDYPFLGELIKNATPSFTVPKYHNVKIAIKYIQKADKIEVVLNQRLQEFEEYTFFYAPDTEQILIETNGDVEKSKNIAHKIESEINKFTSKHNIGMVTINPVYERVTMTGKASAITIEIVYPNGHPARARSNALEEFNAASQQTTYKSPKGEKMDLEQVGKFIDDDAQKGYIRNVIISGSKKIIGLVKTVRW